MPLPDASKRSDRVYTLLQNTDLENLAFATIQATGQPISIEELSEDELRRLVLVNLARLSVKGEWDGLLTASSGGGSNYIGAITQAGDDTFLADQCVTFGGYTISTNTIGTNYVNCYPFVAPKSGALQDLEVRVNASASNTLRVGIYNNDDGMFPTTQVGGDTDFDCSSTGIKTSSPGSTVTLTAGTIYWLCYVWTSNYGAASPTMWVNSGGRPIGWNQSIDQSPRASLIDVSSPTNDLPATMSTSGYDTGWNKKLLCGMNWA